MVALCPNTCLANWCVHLIPCIRHHYTRRHTHARTPPNLGAARRWRIHLRTKLPFSISFRYVSFSFFRRFCRCYRRDFGALASGVRAAFEYLFMNLPSSIGGRLRMYIQTSSNRIRCGHDVHWITWNLYRCTAYSILYNVYGLFIWPICS